MTTFTETRYSLRFTGTETADENTSNQHAIAYDTLEEARAFMEQEQAKGYLADARIYFVKTVVEPDADYGEWANEFGKVVSETLTDVTNN